MTTTLTPCQTVVYTLEFDVDAPPSDVWDVFTNEIGAWWRPDFCAFGPGSTMEFDLKAGGSLIERHEGGGALLWYRVQMVVPGSQLHFVGHTGVDWGGPMTSMLTLTFAERGDGTVLTVRDALFGAVTEDDVANYQGGWTSIFTAMKEYVAAR